MGGAATGAAVVLLSGVYGEVSGNVESILYWMRHGDIWTLPRTLNVLIVPVPALALLAATATAAVALILHCMRQGAPGRALLLMALVMLCLLYAVQTASRPDRPHVAWALWPIVLLMTAVLRTALQLPDNVMVRPAFCGVAGALGICVVAIYAPAPISADLLRLPKGVATNMARLAHRPPPDRDLVHSGLRNAADAIRAQGQRCTYALTNEGLLYPLAQTQPCSRFALPSYVAAVEEEAVITELERASPAVVLFDSPNYAARIDGRSLADRTPRIALWVAQNYPHRIELDGGYVLVSRRPLGP